jgi:serine/threonine protein kinase
VSRKASGSNPAPALGGSISRVSIADLLSTLELRGRSAVVHFASGGGTGNVWFVDGSLADAEFGDVSGEAALYRILGLTQGTFEVSHGPVQRERIIQESVAALIAKRSRRAARWEELVFGGPALDAVPVRRTITPAAPVAPDDRRLLRLIDGRRTLLEVLDESRVDPIQALEILNRLQLEGHFSVERPSSSRPVPPRPDPDPHSAWIVKAIPAPETTPSRTSTLLGLRTPVPPADDQAPDGSRASDPGRTSDPSKPSERGSTATLMGPADPSWLEPVSRSPSSKPPARASTPPDSGPSIVVERVPDESGPTETQERVALAGGAHATGALPRLASDIGDDARDPQLTLQEESGRTSIPPSLPPGSLSQGRVAAGSVIGPYQVLFRLARGESTSIYLCREAEHGSIRSLFALKLFEALSISTDVRQRFEQFAQATAELRHASVTPLLGVGAFEGSPVLAFEYVDGCSISSMLRRRPARRLVLSVIFDAMRGLQAAHEYVAPNGRALPLVHGNLSSRDLLVSSAGVCRVTDISSSYALRSCGLLETVHDPVKLGTLSPERVLGYPVDERSDVFSIGAILYQALTGVEPFGALSVEATRQRLLDSSPEPPSKVGTNPPSAFDSVCLHALERDPDRRFGSIREMLRALEEIALEQDTLASSLEVADFVAVTFRRELELRRLSVLDASRRVRGPRASTSVPPPATHSTESSALPSRAYATPELPLPPRLPGSVALVSTRTKPSAVASRPDEPFIPEGADAELAADSTAFLPSNKWKPPGLVAVVGIAACALLLGTLWLLNRGAAPPAPAAVEPPGDMAPEVAPLPEVPPPPPPDSNVEPAQPGAALSGPVPAELAPAPDPATTPRAPQLAVPPGPKLGSNRARSRVPPVAPITEPAETNPPREAESPSAAPPAEPIPATPAPEPRDSSDSEFRYGI